MNLSETDWRSLIYRGVESDELDYKAAQNWSELTRAGKAKFVRHCLAMANTKGGYVVVGVGEDESGRPVKYTGLTEAESKSFDPSDVGSFIGRFADPPIDFTLERPVVDGKRYAVFVIRRFNSLPHVCTANCGTEDLRQGVFYIRTADASSRPAYRSIEMHTLIQRALRNQRELLGRMIRGVLYENQNTGDERSFSRFQEEVLHSRSFFAKRAHMQGKDYQLEICAAPAFYTEKRYDLSELSAAVSNSSRLNPGEYFLQDPEIGKAYSTNVSKRFLDENGISYWQFFRSGLFHRIVHFPLPKKQIFFSTLVKWCAGSIRFLASLYTELGMADELIHLRFALSPSEGLNLTDSGKNAVCRIPEIIVTLDRTAADLSGSPAAHAAELIRSFCERFNVSDSRLSMLNQRIAGILEKRT